MHATASVQSDYVITPGIATMHVPGPDGGWRRGLFPSQEIKGEGAIVSTIDDMLRWAGHLTRQDRFGSPASWAQLFAPHEGADPRRGAYALGIRLAEYRGLRTIGHTGGVIGGSCDMLSFPDEHLDIVLLVNGAPGVSTALTRTVVDIVLADRLSPVDPPPAASSYRDWLGEWWSAETGMVYGLVDHNGLLKLEICGLPYYSLELKATPDGGLLLPEGSFGEITFGRRDPNDMASLDIGFGDAVHGYRRLDPNSIDLARFAQELEGRYVSADADATATIAGTADKLVMTMRDGFAEAVNRIEAVGADVAKLGTPEEGYDCVISLIRTFGAVQGFRLNTGRTRHLEFLRG